MKKQKKSKKLSLSGRAQERQFRFCELPDAIFSESCNVACSKHAFFGEMFFGVGQCFFCQGSCRRSDAALPVWLHPRVAAGRNKVQLSLLSDAPRWHCTLAVFLVRHQHSFSNHCLYVIVSCCMTYTTICSSTLVGSEHTLLSDQQKCSVQCRHIGV